LEVPLITSSATLRCHACDDSGSWKSCVDTRPQKATVIHPWQPGRLVLAAPCASSCWWVATPAIRFRTAGRTGLQSTPCQLAGRRAAPSEVVPEGVGVALEWVTFTWCDMFATVSDLAVAPGVDRGQEVCGGATLAVNRAATRAHRAARGQPPPSEPDSRLRRRDRLGGPIHEYGRVA